MISKDFLVFPQTRSPPARTLLRHIPFHVIWILSERQYYFSFLYHLLHLFPFPIIPSFLFTGVPFPSLPETPYKIVSRSQIATTGGNSRAKILAKTQVLPLSTHLPPPDSKNISISSQLSVEDWISGCLMKPLMSRNRSFQRFWRIWQSFSATKSKLRNT